MAFAATVLFLETVTVFGTSSQQTVRFKNLEFEVPTSWVVFADAALYENCVSGTGISMISLETRPPSGPGPWVCTDELIGDPHTLSAKVQPITPSDFEDPLGKRMKVGQFAGRLVLTEPDGPSESPYRYPTYIILIPDEHAKFTFYGNDPALRSKILASVKAAP